MTGMLSGKSKERRDMPQVTWRLGFGRAENKSQSTIVLIRSIEKRLGGGLRSLGRRLRKPNIVDGDAIEAIGVAADSCKSRRSELCKDP